MSKTRIAINGFGRIGRLALRRALSRDDVEVVAVNDLAANDSLLYLFKRDSVHGSYDGDVRLEGERLLVDGQGIDFTSFRDPRECAWGQKDVDVVLEATGVFLQRDRASLHLEAGAKRVLISAPAKDPDITVCLGVNHENYDPSAHKIVSNASCTTNCVSPVLKALHEAYGVEYGVLNTVHAYTMGQGLLDSPNKNHRRGRAAALNLVPTTTGAARAVGLVIPDLNGKLDGLAVRTPNPTGSLADLTLTLGADPTIDEVHETLRAFEARYPAVLEVSSDEIVSSDVIGNSHSSIVDTLMTMKKGPLLKLLCWYDNEAGYATRLVDMGVYISTR
ncbi:MAG: type I glyceraldehyde-3-phosphate dehydrogenase [Myxococcota bacterium]|nr:type I glyceraldehyde-3-phosphate dehydrogenase [Myxococcota bacterium]